MKLAKSALRFRDEPIKIIDAAFDTGFAGVNGYQRAFRKEFGCNPKEYFKAPIPLSRFTPYGVKFKDLWKKESLKKMEKVRNVFIRVIEKTARKIIIKRGFKADGYWDYCQEAGCDVWGVWTSIQSLAGEPIGLWFPEHYRKANTSVYVQSVEAAADYNGQIPAGFDMIELPPVKYLMFQGELFAEEDCCEAINAVQASIEKYDPSLLG